MTVHTSNPVVYWKKTNTNNRPWVAGQNSPWQSFPAVLTQSAASHRACRLKLRLSWCGVASLSRMDRPYAASTRSGPSSSVRKLMYTPPVEQDLVASKQSRAHLTFILSSSGFSQEPAMFST